MVSAVPGRLPSTNAPSPEHARRLRALRVGSRGARHRCRCSRARGFRHRDPASGAPSPAEPGPRTRRGHEGQRARPRVLRTGTRRRSSTSATNSTREHDRRTARSPLRVRKKGACVRSRAPLTPFSGIGLATKRAETPSTLRRRGTLGTVGLGRSLANRRIPAPSTGSTAHACDARPKPHATGADGHQPRFHGPGASSLRGWHRPTSSRLAAAEEGTTPTRSARTPPVVRAWQRRLEMPARARQAP